MPVILWRRERRHLAMDQNPYPLEPTPREMRAIADAAVGFVVDFVAGQADAPASDVEGAIALARQIRSDLPSRGTPFQDLLEQLAEGAAKSFNTTGPGYLAYIPGGGLFAVAIADLIADTINRFVGLWSPSPALAQMEWDAIRWLCGLFGYPESARGILTSGGSLSNFSAIVTARKALLAEDFLAGSLYVTEQTHQSVRKPASLAGFPSRRLGTVPVTSQLSRDVAGLRSMIS